MPLKTDTRAFCQTRIKVFPALLRAVLFALAISQGGASLAQHRRTLLPQGKTAAAAQSDREQRYVFVGQGSDTASGSRMTIKSNSPLNDYSAYRSGDHFYIVLPRSLVGPGARGGAGKGYSDMKVQQRGDSVVLSYRIQPGAVPRVEQKFNRLDVVFDAPAGEQSNVNVTQQPAPAAGQNGSQNASVPPANQTNARLTAPEETTTNAQSPANAENHQNASVQTPTPAMPNGMAQPAAEQSHAPNAVPDGTQITQAQPPSTPNADAPVTMLPPASSLGAALLRNWVAALLAALLIVSLGLFFVMRRRAGSTNAEMRRVSLPEAEKHSPDFSPDAGPQTLSNDAVLQNRYRVIRHLGRGGMGCVYEAVDNRLGRSVALKMALVRAAHLRRAFEREARILANLNHPALPRVIDHFGEGDEQFLVMDYVPGLDLKALLEQQGWPFAESEVLGWGDELLDALEYLHSHDPAVVHRDIKPSNLKLTAKRGIVLLDFGLAKGAVGQTASATLSRSIMGYSPHFAPPEQMQGERTDPRSDLYSLAATLYNLLTGQVPPDALRRVTAQLNDEPDPLRPLDEMNPAISPRISSVIMQALALKPSQRWPSAAAMRASLNGLAAPASGTLKTSSDGTTTLKDS
jgi:hypothetical protein